tara:strand:+ start:187 stop:753 length:567 start_codon:yes stop_codon:yes gene_type:complete
MTKDYARQSAKIRTPQGSNKKKSANNGSRSPWFFLLAGVFLGILISLLLKLPKITHEINPAAAKNDEKNILNNQKKSPQFNFYTLLKEAEVIVLEAPKTSMSNGGKKKSNDIFLLQAGSFKTSIEADALRVQLLLLNINAVIEKITINRNETWHRIIAGPFNELSALTEAKKILTDNGIDSLLLKRKL